MRHLGRPALIASSLILAGGLILSLRGSTLADGPNYGPSYAGLRTGFTLGSAYSPYFGTNSLSSLMSLSYAVPSAPDKILSNSPAALSNATDFQSYAGLPAGFTLLNVYTLDSGNAFSLPLNADPVSAVVYRIDADGTISQFFDVAFTAGHLVILTTGEVAPATYLVGTLLF